MTEPIIDEQGRTEPPRSGGPVEVVMGFHRFLRETLWWKCAGLTEEQLRWSPVPSGTSLLGILKHSVDVERWWIAEVIGGLDVESDWTEEDKDAAWRPGPDDTLESVMAAAATGSGQRTRLRSISSRSNVCISMPPISLVKP